MRPIKVTIFIFIIILLNPFSKIKAETQKRAMTFLDIIEMQGIQRGDISPNGKWYIYSLTVPHWQKNRRSSDLYITPIGGKTRQVTFTKDRNEHSPSWYKDSSIFAYLTQGSEHKTQIFFRHKDGDEAQQVTQDKFGVSRYKWTKDWEYLTYLGGDPGQKQIWIMPGGGGNAEQLTDIKTAVRSYLWSQDSKKIYFLATDSTDLAHQDRNINGFDVQISDDLDIPVHLWEIDVRTKSTRRIAEGNDYSVSNVAISDDGMKIAFLGIPTERYTEYTEGEVYLLDTKNYRITRVTDNSLAESNLVFSPDSKWLAFQSPHSQDNTVNVKKIFVIPSEGGKTIELLNDFDYEAYVGFWSDDSRSIYFFAAVGVNNHLFRVSIRNDRCKQITDFGNYSVFFKDEDSKDFFLYYSDPTSPLDCYYSKIGNFNKSSKWEKLTDSNPQVQNLQLSEYETIMWTSSDGVAIEGLLIKPINYNRDRKYPLIVQIHGGPHDANDKRFSASVHVYTANDYLVFQPNYRGSTGYGAKFKRAVSSYFGLSLNDIMTGVDCLIEKGIVHPDSMGVMGWSAGGDYANSILVSTDRFKAISTGAFTVTYYDWENDFESDFPLKFIKNAKTPTLIHFGENDPVMPPLHGEILYSALKKLEVPTEFIVYPNTGHGIWNMRYQMVKMEAEFYWFEKWIRGNEGWLDWTKMNKTIQERDALQID